MKRFLQRFIPFILSLIIGITFASLYIVTQSITINSQQSSLNKSQSAIFNSSKLGKCLNLLTHLSKRKAELVKETADLTTWLDENNDSSKKQKADKIKEIKKKSDEIFNIDIRIDFLKSGIEFRKEYPKESGVITNLLYKENCYEN
jgi:hypothetical protein